MSAYPLATQDASGPLAFSARKKAPDSANGDDAGFDQALAQSAADAAGSSSSSVRPDGAAPAAPASPETASGVDKPILPTAADDVGLWRALPDFAGQQGGGTSVPATSKGDLPPAATYAASSASKPIGASLLARNMAAARLDSVSQASTPIPSSSPATIAAGLASSLDGSTAATSTATTSTAMALTPKALTLKTSTPKASTPPSLERETVPAIMVVSEGAAVAGDHQTDRIEKRQPEPVRLSEEAITRGDRNSVSAESPQPVSSTLKTAVSKKVVDGAETVATPETPNAPTPVSFNSTADPSVGLLAAAPNGVVAFTPRPESDLGAGGKDGGDSVARIGAALAAAGSRISPSATTDKVSSDSASVTGGSDSSSLTAVHVVAQGTWHQPVSPLFSPGLNRAAAADRAALGALRSESKAEDSASPEATASVTAMGGAANLEPQASQLPTSTGVAAFGATTIASNGDRGVQKGAAAPAAAAPETSTANPMAAAPRRDLEITLSPKDLGDLAVRLKSSGDRLDISVMAERGETARMISDRSSSLAGQLQGAGIGLGGIDISAAAKQVPSAADLAGSSNTGASAGGGNANTGGNSQAATQGRDFAGRNTQDQGRETSDRTSDKTSDPRLSGGDRGLYL